MRAVVVSDTHDNYPVLPWGDLLIHCGDFTRDGTTAEVERGLEWLNARPHTYKILVPGNHDRALERFFDKNSGEPVLLGDVFVLVDAQINVHDLRIYGTPWTPPWQNFAFQKPEEELREIFNKIPEHLDILVSHGPALRCLDLNLRGVFCGSDALRKTVEVVQPRYLFHGHIHEAHGRDKIRGTEVFNVSWVALDASGPKPANPPLVLEL